MTPFINSIRVGIVSLFILSGLGGALTAHAVQPEPTSVVVVSHPVIKEKPKPKPKPKPALAKVVAKPPVVPVVSNNILNLLNQVRARNGVPPLQERVDLNQTASLSVDNMIRHKSCCEHGNWEQWFAGTSYGWKGENIAACQVSDAEVVEAWVSSPPHFANIIDTDFKYFGISVKIGTFVGEFSGGEPMQCKYYANHFGG